MLGLRHEGRQSRTLLIGVAIWALGLTGVGVGFGAIGIGALLEIEEGEGPVAWMVVLALAIGILVTPLGMITTGIATVRASVLPPWPRWQPLVVTATSIVGLIVFGATNGIVESIVGAVWFLAFATSWMILGWSLRPAARSAHATT